MKQFCSAQPKTISRFYQFDTQDLTRILSNWIKNNPEEYGFPQGKVECFIYGRDEEVVLKYINIEDQDGVGSLSICPECYCITKTIDGRCGKCKAKK